MKAVVVCFLALTGLALARPEDHYTDRYDNVDINEILGNPKLLKAYVDCCMERGKCTPEAKEMKSHIKEALETDCAKCTETQRTGTNKVLAHLINHEPVYWDELRAKYDPTGKYAAAHEKDLKAIKQ